ncbi:pyrroline-5-carboxylate reductase [Salirhabdus salicampi]|uniref:pyrroline-5-carboxylate reductase n=1 Tax=Salirhabdus salicampi TaxID=476102 RepID=UPI0020C27C42|nr:pyrroline-5-carboxylate reductase [Salirhabdus salicampi]MCP8617185.1 pyrroline-5-carboxylate reductase [Salirhabdus salicampi]
MADSKISFIGAGSMAEAIISGIVSKEYVKGDQIYVTNKTREDRLQTLQTTYGVKYSQNKREVIEGAEFIILSVKPKDIEVALHSIKNYVTEGQIIVSVLAGVSTSYISTQLEKENPVVRAMPNTSATIGYSATAIAAGKYATDKHIEKTKRLFQTIGTTTVVDEDEMHVVTGLSGSGPAYIYYFVEAMEEAAKKAGLEADTSKELILQTLLGAAEMLKVTNESPTSLRKKIMSPGGTTQAGLDTLQKYNYQEALVECVKRAAERSEELGSSFKE